MKPIALLVSIAIYIYSFFLPALYGGDTHLIGLVLAIFGYTQALDGQCFAWLANPLYVASIITLLTKKYKTSCRLSFAAVLIGFDTFRATQFSPNSSGNTVQISGVGSAFYMWEISFIVILAASLWANNSFKPTPLRGAA